MVCLAPELRLWAGSTGDSLPLSETRKHKEPSLWEWNAFRYDEDGSGFCVRAQFCVVFLCVCMNWSLYCIYASCYNSSCNILNHHVRDSAGGFVIQANYKSHNINKCVCCFFSNTEKTSKELISICVSCCMNLRLNYQSSKHSLIWIWRGYC